MWRPSYDVGGATAWPTWVYAPVLDAVHDELAGLIDVSLRDDHPRPPSTHGLP